ncbi:hypothetical protein Tco_1046587, partial [Tanacetum coccineum]
DGLFSFIRHSDLTKVVIGERNVTEGEVKLLTSTEGHVVLLDPPASAASGGSNDSIDKLFDDGNDAEPKHPTKRDDDVLAETIAKDVSKIFIGGKSLATIRDLISEGDDRPTDSVSGLNLRTRPPAMRYVVSSDDSHHSGLHSEINSFPRSPVADAPVMTFAVTTTIAVDVSVVLVSKGRVKSGNLEIFKDYVSAGRANVNVASSSKSNEPETSSDSFYAS